MNEKMRAARLSSRKSRRWLAGAAVILAAAVTACSSSSSASSPSSQGSTASLTNVTAIVANNWSIGQFFGYYLLGIKQGFFKDEGINLTIQQGTGSSTAAQVVANGRATFGLDVSPTAMINADTEGATLKMVGADAQVSQLAVISLKAKPITTPASLAGKTVGVPPGTTQALLFTTFLKKNGVNPSSVHIVNVATPSLAAALKEGRIDAAVAYSVGLVPTLTSMGVATDVLNWSSYGITLAPDGGIITTASTLNSDSSLVKRFVTAASESLEYGLAHPESIYSAGYAVQPDSFVKSVVLAQTQYMQQAISSAGLGSESPMYMNPSSWKSTLSMLVSVGAVKGAAANATTYYTNSFVPQS